MDPRKVTFSKDLEGESEKKCLREEFKKESYKAKIISAIRLLARITLLVNRICVTNLVWNLVGLPECKESLLLAAFPSSPSSP